MPLKRKTAYMYAGNKPSTGCCGKALTYQPKEDVRELDVGGRSGSD